MQSKGVAAVLGSGGHTAEMFRLLDGLEVQPTTFLLCADDQLALRMLSAYRQQSNAAAAAAATVLPRPRRVGQSYLTSIFTTLWTVVYCVRALWSQMPDLVICNGPGICVCIALAIHLLSWLRWRPRAKILYVESFARTRRLSLTGRIMTLFADRFLVQWPKLEGGGSLLCCRREYHGPLV